MNWAGPTTKIANAAWSGASRSREPFGRRKRSREQPVDRQSWFAPRQTATRRGVTNTIVAGTRLVRRYQTRVEVVLAAHGMGHSLTEYPCRLPDGSIGRTAILSVRGEWIAVCVNRSRA